MKESDYIETLRRERKGKPEIDAILLAHAYKIELQIYYIEESNFQKQIFLPHTIPEKSDRIIRLHLNSDGHFDVICNKEYIRVCGICQSLVLDVSRYALGA